MTDKAEELAKAWARPEGWGYFSDVNNSVVGLWYISAAFAFMLFGGALALIMRLQLAVPDSSLVSAETYNRGNSSAALCMFQDAAFDRDQRKREWRHSRQMWLSS